MNAKKHENVLTAGTSVVNIAIPIIGPPEMIFSGCVLNPPAASISSCTFVPVRTLKLLGFLIASPVTVTTRSYNGLPSLTASLIATIVATLSTMHPASAGNMLELMLLPVVA